MKLEGIIPIGIEGFIEELRNPLEVNGIIGLCFEMCRQIQAALPNIPCIQADLTIDFRQKDLTDDMTLDDLEDPASQIRFRLDGLEIKIGKIKTVDQDVPHTTLLEGSDNLPRGLDIVGLLRDLDVAFAGQLSINLEIPQIKGNQDVFNSHLLHIQKILSRHGSQWEFDPGTPRELTSVTFAIKIGMKSSRDQRPWRNPERKGIAPVSLNSLGAIGQEDLYGLKGTAQGQVKIELIIVDSDFPLLTEAVDQAFGQTAVREENEQE